MGRSSGVGTDIKKEKVGAGVSSAGVRISVDISSQEQSRNSPGCRISSTGQRTIITGRAGIISRRLEILLSSTGMQMEPEITLDLLNDVMGKLYIPSKAIEAMQSREDHIELGVG